MSKYEFLVRLDDDTCGYYESDTHPDLGQQVEVQLADENGCPITVSGRVAEILAN